MRTASRIVGAFSGAALVRRWNGRRAVGHRRSLSNTPAENWRKESDRKKVETAGITFKVRFIGLEVVESPYDENGCRRTLRKYGRAGHKQTHPILLSLSSNKVQIIQFPRFVACEHSVTAISACYTDSRRPRLFAYIVKDYRTGNHLCLAFKTLRRTGVTGSRLEEAFGHAFNCCVDQPLRTSAEEECESYVHEQRVIKSGKSDLLRSNSHYSAADFTELHVSHQSHHQSSTLDSSTVNGRGNPSSACKVHPCSESTIHQRESDQHRRHLVCSISDGFLLGIRIYSPSLPQSEQAESRGALEEALEYPHTKKSSDETHSLTVEDSDDNDDGEREAGKCSNVELVFEGTGSTVQLSETNSWYQSVKSPSLDQLDIPRGNGQEDLHHLPPPQLERQIGYINLPDIQREDMRAESRAEYSTCMSHSCLIMSDSMTECDHSDFNYTSSFSVHSKRQVHRRSSGVCSRHEEFEFGGTLQVKDTETEHNLSTPPHDLSETDPPLSPLHVHTPRDVLLIPRSKRDLRLSCYKTPAPLPSPPVPPRWASLRCSAKSSCSYFCILEKDSSSSSTLEHSCHSKTAAKGSSTTAEYSGYPCPMFERTSPMSEMDGVSLSVSLSGNPGHELREPPLHPPPLPPKTYKSSLTTVACSTADGPPLPSHRKRQSAKCSSPGTCSTPVKTCGHGTCSLCKFEQAALQASQLLHTMHSPPHTHTTGGTLSCIIATWQS